MNTLYIIALYILTDLKQMLAQAPLTPPTELNETVFNAVDAAATVVSGGLLDVSYSINTDGFTMNVKSTHLLGSAVPVEQLQAYNSFDALRNQITVVSKMAKEDGVATVLDQRVKSLMYDGKLIHINPDGVSLASVPSILKRLKPRN